jgi:DNA-binding NtrC family response regulator
MAASGTQLRTPQALSRGFGTWFNDGQESEVDGMDIECDSPTRAYAAARPRNRGVQHTHGIAVVAGPGAGLRHLMDGEELRIGKAPSNHLCLPDPTVSRFHCVIERTPRGLLLRDLGSFNGTQVAGCWVESAYVAPEVPIQIGQSVVQIFVAERGDDAPADPAPRILGASAATQKLVALLPQLAKSGATILLEGETGTGKSMVAELIHRMGPRAGGPFIVVDGGALSPSLVESELFGHERGSFTGASERRLGAFESAQGGTVFLDEIGELSLELQPKLLRALEERVIRRLGSAQMIRLDLQIIAATNRNLQKLVSEGRFRADLYYRLEALRLTIPPLRERRDDIPQLVEHFCRRTCAEVSPQRIEELKGELSQHSWPGNVRELRNAVERAVLFDSHASDFFTPTAPSSEDAGPALPAPLPAASDEVDADLETEQPASPVAFAPPLPFRAAKEAAIAQWERGYLSLLMQEAAGNLSRAARLAQIDRGHLRDLLRQHQIAGR